jgi:hypothetical protein
LEGNPQDIFDLHRFESLQSLHVAERRFQSLCHRGIRYFGSLKEELETFRPRQRLASAAGKLYWKVPAASYQKYLPENHVCGNAMISSPVQGCQTPPCQYLESSLSLWSRLCIPIPYRDMFDSFTL